MTSANPKRTSNRIDIDAACAQLGIKPIKCSTETMLFLQGKLDETEQTLVTVASKRASTGTGTGVIRAVDVAFAIALDPTLFEIVWNK